MSHVLYKFCLQHLIDIYYLFSMFFSHKMERRYNLAMWVGMEMDNGSSYAASIQEEIVTEVLGQWHGHKKGVGSTLSQKNIFHIPKQQPQPNYEEFPQWFQQVYTHLNHANIHVPPAPCISATTTTTGRWRQRWWRWCRKLRAPLD